MDRKKMDITLDLTVGEKLHRLNPIAGEVVASTAP